MGSYELDGRVLLASAELGEDQVGVEGAPSQVVLGRFCKLEAAGMGNEGEVDTPSLYEWEVVAESLLCMQL